MKAKKQKQKTDKNCKNCNNAQKKIHPLNHYLYAAPSTPICHFYQISTPYPTLTLPLRSTVII